MPGHRARPGVRAEAVVAVLDRIVGLRGPPPGKIRLDNGPEFVSRVLDHWAYRHGVTLDFSRPGKPTDNSYIESFNRRRRDECLNTHWFLSLADARTKIEAWRRNYNECRPHTSLGLRTPADEAGKLPFQVERIPGEGQVSAPLEARLDDTPGLRPRPSGRGRPGRCATPRLRAPASRQPPNPRFKSPADSTHRWMNHGGHVISCCLGEVRNR